MRAPTENADASIGTRWPGLAAAAFLMLLAGLVIADSLRVGIGWADDGPRSGYFPFCIGLLLLGANGWTFGATLWRWRQADREFASRSQLAQVVSVFVPMLVCVAGVLPGLGGANGIAILLPLTFSMNPTSAIIMLSCICWGALFGGAITSILFNIPGEPGSVATTFDGHPMAFRARPPRRCCWAGC